MPQQPTRISGDGSEYLGKRLLVGITYEDHDGGDTGTQLAFYN